MTAPDGSAEQFSNQGIQRRALRGALYAVLGNLPALGLNAIATLLAGRILGPSAFGALSLALVLYGVSNLVTSSGLTAYILRNPATSDRAISIAWTVAVLRGLVLTAVICAVASPATALFGGRAEDAALLRALAVGHFLGGLSNLHVLRFAHHLKFSTLALLDASGTVSTYVTALTCLVIWRTPLAYAIGLTLGRSVSTLVSWFVAERRPRPDFDRDELLGMWRFSRFIALNGIITYLMLNGDNLIVSRLAGARGLGLYALAFQLANAIALLSINPLWKVLIPVFGRLRSDLRAFGTAVQSTVAAFAACASCFSATAWAAAPDVFRFIDASGKWDDAVPVFRALCAFALTRAINQVLGQTMVALGKPGYLTALTGIQLVLLAPLLWCGYALGGLVGVSYAMTFLAVTAMLALMLLAPRLLPVSVARLLTSIGIPAPVAIGCAWIGSLAASVVELPLARLLIAGAVSGSLFLLAWETLSASPLRRWLGCPSFIEIARRALKRGEASERVNTGVAADAPPAL